MRSDGSEFDWDLFWRDPTDVDEMEEGARRMARRLLAFMEVHPPATVADFGCGPALTLFRLARERPDVEFFGFDASGEVIEEDRRRARAEGLDNLAFDTDALPRLSTDGVFDLVVCIATLHYVEDIEDAVRSLFQRVSPGGHLVFNYPNVHTMHYYRRWAKERDTERRQRRSRLVIEGRNLLTLSDIARILGARPRNFWRAMGEATTRENVCVYARRGIEGH